MNMSIHSKQIVHTLTSKNQSPFKKEKKKKNKNRDWKLQIHLIGKNVLGED